MQVYICVKITRYDASDENIKENTNILKKKYSVCLSFSDWSHYKLDQDLESLKQKLTENTTNNKSFK